MGGRLGQGTVALALATGCVVAASASAAVPIPEGPDASTLPVFIGAPATPHPSKGTTVPQNPFMAPNGRSNLHDDAYMTDSYKQSGPLGRAMTRSSTFLARECASAAFDAQGRLVTVCVGLDGPQLQLIDPHTLDTLAVFPLPPRIPSGGSPFTDSPAGAISTSTTRTAPLSRPRRDTSGSSARTGTASRSTTTTT